MNENIDLTKILKNCPVGWTLYSSVYGEAEFLGILHDYISLYQQEDEWHFPNIQRERYPIQLRTDSGEYCVSREGRHKYGVGECTLFPSKDQRDWNKFKAPWYKKCKFDPKTLKPFDKVLVRNYNVEDWCCDSVSHVISKDSISVYVSGRSVYEYCIPYNNDTKHLVGTKKRSTRIL